MKDKLFKAFSFGLILFVVLGCSLANRIKKEVEKTQAPQIVTSTDGKFQLTVPGSWQTETTLNEEAALQASSRIGELYVIVIRESKEDFAKTSDVDFVTNLVRENFKNVATEPMMTELT